MLSSFGDQLVQFALAVDVLSEDQHEDFQQRVFEFLTKHVGAVQVGLFRRYTVGDSDHLESEWSRPRFDVREPLRDENGEYSRQLALALGECRPLWVVSTTGSKLSESNRGVDFWDDLEPDEALPPFPPSPEGGASRTSIVLVWGEQDGPADYAFLIEVGSALRPSAALRQELQKIQKAVRHATRVRRYSRLQALETKDAITHLGTLIDQVELPADGAGLPEVFVASSSRATEDVTTAIQEVLDGLGDYVSVQPWHEIDRPGNINRHTVEAILRATYGVCYLSEPNPKAASSTAAAGEDEETEREPAFVDNANVLFEAGMLHIATGDDPAAGTGWLPVREVDSPDAPFDFAAQRMVEVQRDDGGGLDTTVLKEDLESKLKALFQAEIESGLIE